MKRCCPHCGSKYFVHFRYGADIIKECPNSDCDKYGSIFTEPRTDRLSIQELKPEIIRKAK